MKHVYRGYSILYYRAGDWLAYVYPPGAIRAADRIIKATEKEGEDVLLARVRTRIDVELEENPRERGRGEDWAQGYHGRACD